MVSILGYVLEVMEAKMAGAKMAEAASAQFWIQGSRTDLWYQPPRISAMIYVSKPDQKGLYRFQVHFLVKETQGVSA